MTTTLESWASGRRVRGLLLASMAVLLAVLLAACGGGSGTSRPTVSGIVTYDHVPAESSTKKGVVTAELDYDKTVALPARSVVVEAIGADGSVLDSTLTADDGAYELAVPINTDVHVRVRAHIRHGSADAPNWDFSVRDNTSAGYATAPGKADEYSIAGATFNTRRRHWHRDLHATSGWTGTRYDAATRVAGPFQILDQIETAARKMLAEESDLKLPALNMFWSPRNRPVDDGTEPDVESGLLATSYYDSDPKTYGLYLLGAQNIDTDEYDVSVLVHEFGHYVENKLSRADSIGGSHGEGDSLDMRVAFGEAWGNSFSSMVRQTASYVDTVGRRQAQAGVVQHLDAIPDDSAKAWFDESAVGYVLYSLSTAREVGFGPIYQTMRKSERVTPAWTSLFSFATGLRGRLDAAGQAKLDGLLAEINTVNGEALDIWGTRQAYETASADLTAVIIPVTTRPGATPKTLCVSNELGGYNKLGNRRFLRLKVTQAGRYRLLATPIDDDSADNYGFTVARIGKDVKNRVGDEPSNGRGIFDLSAGEYAATFENKEMDDAPADGAAPTVRCARVSFAAN